MTNIKFDDLLLGAEKPSRYIGAEVNSVHKNDAEINFLLAFPDTYEVGMSHLGLQILYSILNEIPGVFAQRCFAPWPDRERQLRERRLPLTSLEEQKPLRDFDIVGFSLQYELSYTNVLNMLDLGGMALRRNERNDGDPLVIAGGPCCFNPSPLTDFIDAFVIGDGEEAVSEIAETLRAGKKNKLSRQALIRRLADIPGIYAPAVHDKNMVIRKRNPIDLNLWPYPTKPVVPLMQTIHDRIVLEIARGCTRGCRFCQAGMLCRPYRERNQSLLVAMADQALAATGHDEISLLALSSGDYSCLEPLLITLAARYQSRRVALALPSLRVESLNDTLIEEIKRTRKTSFTLAPEAGTDKMRRIINKGNTAGELLATVDRVFAAGWKSIKLYFMIGLPGETEADLEGIIDLGYQALRAAKGRGEVTISLSTFVPKPHTPFQWERQISLAETSASQNFIRNRIKSRKLGVKWHDARMSLLEGIFSRGDEKAGGLLEKAFRRGCRFDGWSDIFRFDLWQEVITELGIAPEDYLRKRDINDKLPWDNIDCGVTREFLLNENKKALEGAATTDCRLDSCSNCGACNFTNTRNIFAQTEELPASAAPAASPNTDAPEKNYRLTFTKLGRSRFLSHLELAAALLRALRRSSLKLVYSSGFHPHPKISFATATSVGMESRQEFADITAKEFPGNFNSLQEEINSVLPQGVKVTEIRLLSYAEKALAHSLSGFVYELNLPAGINANDLKALQDKLDKFLAAPSFTIERLAKGKTIRKDIRPFVESIAIEPTDKKISMRLLYVQTGSVRPSDIIRHVLGFNDEQAVLSRVVKTSTILNLK